MLSSRLKGFKGLVLLDTGYQILANGYKLQVDCPFTMYGSVENPEIIRVYGHSVNCFCLTVLVVFFSANKEKKRM